MGFMADKGRSILRNGYNPIPVKPGQKAPSIDDWRREITEADVENWVSNGRANHNVGITTGAIVLIDSDIQNQGMSKRIKDWIELHLGFAPVRVGNYPKFGMMFRTEKPFRKISSQPWLDPEGRKVQIEILGEGQQFVAFGRHPDTGKDYYWIGAENPEVTPASDLQDVTEADCRQVCNQLDRYCEEEGWERIGGTPLPVPIERPGWDDDELIGDNDKPLDLSEEQVRDYVMIIPNGAGTKFPERFDWFKFIAAISHQTQKSEEGRETALLWSEEYPEHNLAEFEKAWNSLGKFADNRRPITFRYILKLAKEYQQANLAEQFVGFTKRLKDALTTDELELITAEIRKIKFADLQTVNLIAELRTAHKQITGTPLGIKEARDLIRHQAVNRDWLEGWVYLTHVDRFFNTKTKTMITERAFTNAFGRFLPGVPTTATRFALDQAKIPTFHMALYMPTEGPTFTMNGKDYVNTYDDSTAAIVPAHPTARDTHNVGLVKNHLKHLFPDPRDVRILTSWLASLVQSKRRPNWAVVMQGVDGDGRTFFSKMMAAVLGGPNVYPLKSQTLSSPYNDWAQGHLLIFIEELRLVGHNRYDVLNSIKDNITNDVVEINPKFVNPYSAPNNSAYLATTNFKNALPINDNDRRYHILMSQWQEAAPLAAFLADHPDYFDNLYNAIEESAGAIRGWLETYELDPEFKRQGRAPFSHGHVQMAAINKSDEEVILSEIIADGHRQDISNELVVVSALIQELYGQGDLGLVNPPNRGYGPTIKLLLVGCGFNYLGRFRIDGKRESVWTKTPEKWSKNPEVAGRQIATRLKGDL